MKALSLALASLLALAAAQVPDTQSPPFVLQIKTSNETLNNQYLRACHAGAALEGLCPGVTHNPSSDIYYLNTTQYSGETGNLIWNLPVNMNGEVILVSSPVTLNYRPTSNLAVPLFSPGYGMDYRWGFDDDGKMYILSSFDETKATPLNRPETEDAKYYNWHVCWTWVGGYWYQGLTVVTFGVPANPTCVKVDVVRTFV